MIPGLLGIVKRLIDTDFSKLFQCFWATSHRTRCLKAACTDVVQFLIILPQYNGISGFHDTFGAYNFFTFKNFAASVSLEG